MERGRSWSWWVLANGGRRGVRYVEPLVEIADVTRSKVEVRVRPAAADAWEAVLAEETRGLAPGSTPTLPARLRADLENARYEHGVKLRGRVLDRWFDAIAAGDADAALRPLRDGTIAPNAVLKGFGVAYTRVIECWPSEDVAALVPALVQLGADVDAVDAMGAGSLHSALVRPLMLASAGRRSTRTGSTGDGVAPTVRALLAHGARPRPDARGRTPLHVLASAPVPVDAWADVVAALREAGDDPNTADDERGYTALHALVDVGQARPEDVQLLIARGADLEARDHEGRTAFDLAQLVVPSLAPLLAPTRARAPHDALRALEALSEREPRCWRPPFRHVAAAVEARDLAAVQQLLDDGADPDGRELSTASPLRLARASGLVDIEAALLAAGASRDEGPLRAWQLPEDAAHLDASRERLVRALTALVPPERPPADGESHVDDATARALRAHPALVAERVAGRTIAELACFYGLPRTLEAWLELASPSEAARQQLLDASLGRESLDAFGVLLAHGADPFERKEWMSVFQRAALEGRVDALVACCASGSPAPARVEREARLALKNLPAFGQGRSHYVAGFLRHVLLALCGAIEGTSVRVRKRAQLASTEDWGAQAYVRDLEGRGRVPAVVAVRAPVEAVLAVRAAGGRSVVPEAHRVGVPWVPRAELVFRLGASAWTLWVAHGASPETPAQVARGLTDALGALALSTSRAVSVVHHPGGDSVPLPLAELDRFAVEQQLLLPALELPLDLGLVGLDVRGLVPDAVTDAAVVVVSPDRWRERASAEELAVVAHVGACRSPSKRAAKPATKRARGGGA